MSIPHYAVLGHPIAHSLSARIHLAFGQQVGIKLTYLALDTAEHGFSATLARFGAAGGLGANVTVPNKSEAAGEALFLSPRARRAGVANTLAMRDGVWHGFNTDGSGLVRDLRARRGLDLHGMRVLMLGAGGAAQGVAPALLDADIDQLVVANRTRSRAYDLIDRLGDMERTRACTLREIASMGDFDMIVQATSAGHEGVLPTLPDLVPRADTVCVDLNYGRPALSFMAWAHQHEVKMAFDGLGMLVEQAADAFEIWHGVRPDSEPVYAQLRLSTGRV